MKLDHVRKPAVLFSAALLLMNALLVRRDYQDAWILQGLEYSFAIFVATVLIALFFEKKLQWMLIIAVVSRSVLASIPSLKYVWYMGSSMDQNIHYGLANYLMVEGKLVPVSLLSIETQKTYVNTPGIQLSFAGFSIITGIPLVDSVKLLPIIIPALFPLLIYVAVRSLHLSQERDVVKYTLIFSSLLFIPALSYIVSGTLFGAFFLVFILLQMVKLGKREGGSAVHSFLFFFFTLALVIFHSFSAAFLVMIVAAVFVYQKVRPFRIGPVMNLNLSAYVAGINLAWLYFKDQATLQTMARQLAESGLFEHEATVAGAGRIPNRLFQLVSINVFEGAKTVLAMIGIDVIFALITVLGLVAVARAKQKSETLRLVSLVNMLFCLALLVGIGMGVGGFYWNRVIRYTSIFSAIFFGIMIAKLGTKRHGSILVVLLLVVMTLITPLEFGCQPIVSPASVISSDLPSNEPLSFVYSSEVNSIYQRKLVEFANKYIDGIIACDDVTRSQIIGLANINLAQRHLAWVFPLDKKAMSANNSVHYDVFLTHLPGKAGVFHEQAEVRTKQNVTVSIIDLQYDIVYSNEQSFVLYQTPKQ